MKNKKISIHYPLDQYKYLTICCEKLGVSIEEFIVSTALEKVDKWEDEVMLERWKKDETRAKIDADQADPNRIVYYQDGDAYREIPYAEMLELRKKEIKNAPIQVESATA